MTPSPFRWTQDDLNGEAGAGATEHVVHTTNLLKFVFQKLCSPVMVWGVCTPLLRHPQVDHKVFDPHLVPAGVCDLYKPLLA